MRPFERTHKKLDTLDDAGMALYEVSAKLRSLGMESEARELDAFYVRNIDTAHRFICEHELPVTIKGGEFK